MNLRHHNARTELSTEENHTVIRFTRLAAIAALASFAFLLAAGSAAAADEAHPPITSLGAFTNPNGIAVDEATGDVYVADIAGANEQQTVTLEGGPEGGSFALEFQGQSTSALSISGTTAPTAGEVEAALQGLSTIGSANVVVTEEGALPGTLTYTISFQGSLAVRNVPLLACDGSALSGGTSAVCAVATITQGVANTVSKFDSAGNPVDFTAGSATGTNQLTGADTPASSFEFPNVPDNPAAIAVDNSCAEQSPPLSGAACEASDASAGDLYVLDAGHNVIDKFAPSGAYLGQLTGPFGGSELLGIGVDGSGRLHVYVFGEEPFFELYDNSLANQRLSGGQSQTDESFELFYSRHGFAVDQAGASFGLLACGCFEKVALNLDKSFESLGRVDDGSTGLAAAADPATGHLYVDDGTLVTEWDTGQMNGGPTEPKSPHKAQRLSAFGSSQLSSSGQGGIAVNGSTGRIYVSNPTDGTVYVYGSAAPAPATGTATEVTKTAAALHAIVNPRGALLTSCQFEYVTSSASRDLKQTFVQFANTVPCDQTPAQIGEGTQPVPVTATISGLTAGSLYRFRIVVANAAASSASAGLFPTLGPGFGIKSFEVSALNEDGSLDTQAGSHPYKLITRFEFNTRVVHPHAVRSRWVTLPQGNFKDISVDLPPGLYGDPHAVTKQCSLADLSAGGLGDNCPLESQVGSLAAELTENAGVGSTGGSSAPLFSLVPPPGVPFMMSAHILVPNAFINVSLPAGRDSRLQATSTGVPATVPVYAVTNTVFGTPPDGAVRPLLTMPTACNGPLTSRITADSYQEPGRFANAETVLRNAAGNPTGMSGCAKLLFPPTSTSSPDVSDASSPTGLEVGLHVPQKAGQNLGGLAESNVRDVTTTLPKGFTLNPSGADGLKGCTEQQAGFTGFEEFNPQLEPGNETATFTPEMPQPLEPGVNFCPDGSKIGAVQVKTPLLDNPLEGSLYLAKPYQNPFGSLVALYLFAEDPVSGTIVKQVGEVHLDPSSGQILTTFHNTPDIPFEDLTLHLFGGNRAPLVTPSTCGEYTTEVLFTPWSGNGPVNTTPDFQIDHGQNGGPCPTDGAPPFHPHLSAGTRSNAAGSYSPLDLELTRGDGEQEFTHFSIKLPPGLAGKIAGIPECSDAAIAIAKARTGPHGGQEEEEAPSCPAASEVGHTLAAAGVGSVLVNAPGKLYLAGPYHGAPLSVVSITAAHVGAFDFGTVVVRQALRINPETAEVFVDATGSDPLPHIIQGVPTHLRKILIYLDRPQFTFNPTSCEPTSIASTVLGSGLDFASAADDVPLVVTSPFQAADCASLPFKPKLKLSLHGSTKRTGTPAFTAKLTMKPGEANIAQAAVTLPRLGVPRQRPHRHRLHQGRLQPRQRPRRRLPGRLGLRPRQSRYADPRRSARRPRLPTLQRRRTKPPRPGRRPPRQADQHQPGRLRRLGPLQAQKR